MLVYKLTNQDNTTYNGTIWGENVSRTTNGEGPLCWTGWLHFYIDPYLAVLLNPIHANIRPNPKLWEAEAQGQFKYDRDAKGGCTHLTTLKEIPLPQITPEQKVKFAILCTKMSLSETDIYYNQGWLQWADDWLSNKHRKNKIKFEYDVISEEMMNLCTLVAHLLEKERYNEIDHRVATVASYAKGHRGISLVKIAHQAMITKDMDCTF